MKLIKLVPHIEGEKYESNIFLTFGKHLKHEYEYIRKFVEDRSKIVNTKQDGWYFRVELPLSKVVTICDPSDFINKTLPCRKVFLIRKRPGTQISKTWAWFPVDE